MSDSSVVSSHSDTEPSQPTPHAHALHDDGNDTAALTSEDESDVSIDPDDNVQHQETASSPSYNDERYPSPSVPHLDGVAIPLSKWKKANASEIDLSISLHRLTAQNLSVHLYNAMKLKQRSLDQCLIECEEATSPRAKGPFAFNWTPPKSWTAWPMPTALVPRGHGNEKATSLPPPYLIKPIKLSQNLRELLLAEILRQAKTQFHKRKFDSSEKDISQVVPVDSQAKTSEIPSDTSMESSQDSETSSSLESTIHVKKRMTNMTMEKSGSSTLPKADDLQPALLADDLHAASILQPSILNILAKVDTLLMNLHHSQKSCCSVDPRGSAENTDTEPSSKSRSKSIKPKRCRSTTRPRSSTFFDNSTSIDNDFDRRSEHRRKRRFSSQDDRLQRRKRKLGLRGWSDVLGIASMSGFQPAVFQRAAARCESLFEEQMQFRKLHESRAINYQDSENANAQNIDSPPPMDGFAGVHVDGFLQPLKAKRSWRVKRDKQK